MFYANIDTKYISRTSSVSLNFLIFNFHFFIILFFFLTFSFII